MASISHWYNLALFTAVRDKDDGRNEKLVSHYLRRYSFVVPLTDEVEGEESYQIRAYERGILQRFWIVEAPDAYRSAHQRAFDYWQTNPDPNPFAQAQNHLYHLLFVDEQAGMDYLIDRFRIYYNDRQFSAMARLLDTAKEARRFLALLTDQPVAQLGDLLTLMEARVAQLRGDWAKGLIILAAQRQNNKLTPEIKPFVHRAYGRGLANQGLYVDAVAEYRAAIGYFEALPDSPENEAERAQTLIAMGDAYVDLAISARGDEVKKRKYGRFPLLHHFVNFFLSLPLAIYLSFAIGPQVWLPRFWPVFDRLDWIIARLFAEGARHYKTADPILEKYGSPAEGVAADEKLANLYLTMGAASKAEGLFRLLLDDESLSLSEYRRATVSLGLGQTLLQQDDPLAARDVLDSAIPALRLYEDESALAEIYVALAETFIATDDVPEALSHWRQALRLYQKLDNRVRQTEIANQLEAFGDTKTAETIIHRTYPIRYRHIATYVFKRLTSVVTLALIFIIPIMVIRVETGSTIIPEITFQATPLLRSDDANFVPEISQGVTGSTLAPPSNPEILMWLAVELLASYLILFTVAGYIAILQTPLQRVQAAGSTDAIHIDANGIRVGQRPAIVWSDMTRLTAVNAAVWRENVSDISQFVVESPTHRLVVPGRADGYEALYRRVAMAAPERVRQTNLSFSMLRSPLGGMYVVSGAFLLLISLLSGMAPPLVTLDLIGAYSLADLYPFFYLGLFIPIVWWFLILPSEARVLSGTTGPSPWWLMAVGVAIILWSIFIRLHPWLTVPDLYPGLTAVVLSIAALRMAWRARDEKKAPLYTPAARLVLSVTTVLIFLMVGSYLWRDVWAYHYLVMGHTWRDRALVAEDNGMRADYLLEATFAYAQSRNMAELHILGMAGRHGARHWFGVPTAHQTIWVAAMNGHAAMQSMRGQFQDAIDDYTEVLPYTDLRARTFGSRAVAYQGLGTYESEQAVGVVEVGVVEYQQSLADYDIAIRLDPEDAAYYLWRGVGYHALNERDRALADYEEALHVASDAALSPSGRVKALTGKAWLLYSSGDYEGGVTFFQMALDEAERANLAEAERHFWQRALGEVSDKTMAQAGLGLGYAYYSLRQYDKALASWDKAAEWDPTDPLILISQGTLHWRIGTLGDDLEAAGSNRCRDETLTEAEYLQAQSELEQAVALFDRAIAIADQQADDVAFTYRTKAQVQFLLKDCPDYEATEMLMAAIDSYGDALALAPDNAIYWHIRGRLSYSLWFNAPERDDLTARAWLFSALEDNDRALALDPVDRFWQGFNYAPNRWQDIIEREAVAGTLAYAEVLFDSGNHEEAYAYHELVARNQPDNGEAVLRAALSALVSGNKAQAVGWYKQGIEMALAAGDETAVLLARADLDDFLSEGVSPLASEPLVSEVEALFVATGLDFDRPATTAIAVEWALAAWQVGERAEAVDLMAEAVDLARAAGRFGALKTAVLAVPATEAEGAALFTPIAQALPMMVAAIDEETAVADVMALWTVAVVLDEPTIAGRLAHEAIWRTALAPANLTLIRDGVQRDLRTWWAEAGTGEIEGDVLLAAHQALLPTILIERPEMVENGLFWRYQAWYKFYLGLTWFRLGAEDTAAEDTAAEDTAAEDTAAAEALVLAQADGAEAERVEPGAHNYVYTYLSEGAWGWFYLVRGDDYADAGAYALALADYETAVAAYQPVGNRDALKEIADAAFRAGQMALLLGKYELAEIWYERGLELVAQYGSMAALDEARQTLAALIVIDENLAEVGSAILADLAE